MPGLEPRARDRHIRASGLVKLSRVQERASRVLRMSSLELGPRETARPTEPYRVFVHQIFVCFPVWPVCAFSVIPCFGIETWFKLIMQGTLVPDRRSPCPSPSGSHSLVHWLV